MERGKEIILFFLFIFLLVLFWWFFVDFCYDIVYDNINDSVLFDDGTAVKVVTFSVVCTFIYYLYVFDTKDLND